MRKSHVQIAKGHMKPFAFREGKMVNVLDISEKVIYESDINFLDTRFGFYDDNVETAMNDVYENRFFSLRQKIVSFFDRKINRIKIENKDRKTIIDYLNLSILRSKTTLKQVNEGSVVAKILGDFSNNELVKARLIGVLKESLFVDYGVMILKNDTDTNFVIPSNSYYFARNVYKSKISADFLIIIPITPKIAFLLFPYFENLSFFDENKGFYMTIKENDDINIFNKMALTTEIEYDSKFIVSITRSELETLLTELL